MTYEEAKTKFKDIVQSEFDRLTSHYDSEVDDEVFDDTGKVNEILELNKIVREALEKQIPKKPILENTKGIVGINMWHCPVCKNEIISDWNKDIANHYCHHCGQALDWSAK